MSRKFSSAGIIGYGRFGQLLGELLSISEPNLDIAIYDPNSDSHAAPESLDKAVGAELIFIACPISKFENVLTEISTQIAPTATVLDVCSTKLHPKECMERLLPEAVQIVCTHPMFGPATYLKSGRDLSAFKIVVDQVRCSDDDFAAIKSLFNGMGPEVVLMSCDEHDRLTARFQFTALSTALLLKDMELNRSFIDTGSATAMMDFVEMISIDKQLLRDMYAYNPYCSKKWSEFEQAFFKLKELFS